MNDDLEGGNVTVLEGRGGQLFLESFDGERAIDLFTDPASLAASVRDAWQRSLRDRGSYFDEHGIVYQTLIVPDSSQVYPDRLPEGVTLAKASPFEQIVAELDDESRQSCVYPREDLRDGRETNETFALTDSHWTDWGAYLGYRASMKHLQRLLPAITVLEQDRLTWDERRWFGDLGTRMEPERSELIRYATVQDSRCTVVRKVATHQRKSYLVVEQDRADLPTAVVFRDSFMSNAQKFFSESFRRVVYVQHAQSLMFDLIEAERPDVVIYEVAERCLNIAPREPMLLDFRMMFGDLLLDDPDAVAAQVDSRSRATTGDFAGALVDSDRVLAHTEPNARVLVHRASLLRGLGEQAAGLECLRIAASIDPEDAPVRYLFASALLEKGRVADAHAQALRALELEPRHLEFWATAITTALQLEHNAQALALAEEAVRLHPGASSAFAMLSRARALAGDLEGAEASIRTAVTLEPTPGALGQLASVLMARGKWSEARESLREVQALDPASPKIADYITIVEQKLAATS